MSWHATDGALVEYHAGRLDAVQTSSVEGHLLSCEACRRRFAGSLPPQDRHRLWSAIVARTDPVTVRPVERVLLLTGVREPVARLLAATRSLTVSWLVAVGFALAFAVVAVRAGSAGYTLFLTVAPLIPLAGVAVAYGPGVDPTYEVGTAAPFSSFRLLLLRGIAVLGTSCLLVGGAALALPMVDWRAAAWLLPAFALSTLSLALSSYWSPRWAFGFVGAGWIGLVMSSQLASGAAMAMFHTAGQVCFAGAGAAAFFIIISRRESFERGRPA
jgi:hypothetical protein